MPLFSTKRHANITQNMIEAQQLMHFVNIFRLNWSNSVVKYLYF